MIRLLHLVLFKRIIFTSPVLSGGRFLLFANNFRAPS
jgi:hypothetical protein